MKSKIIITLTFVLLSSFGMSQNTSKGEVISVFAFGENSYSFIHEKGTGHYYKTSIHNTGELNQGQFVELLFDQVDNISNSVQVNAPTLTNSLFCQRISEEEIGNEKGEDRNKIDYRKYVSYNAKHDVLVFETWDDVKTLDILLQERVLNYPFNRGNDDEISTTIQSIKENGWTLSENPSGKEVSLEKFKELLDLSHPLSTNVLIDILELDEGLNPDFIKDVFISNLPFSSTLEIRLMESAIDPVIKNQIINANDHCLVFPNYAYQDFISTFSGYNSLYKKLKTEEFEKLESGMDPASPEFDNAIVDIPFERLIMNSKHEVWIEGVLYKFYKECFAIALQNPVDESYQSLAGLNDDGSPIVPELEEEISGIPNEEMDNYLPSEYMAFNPQEFDPLGGTDNDPYYNTALQEYNIIPGCPKSNFTYWLYSGGDLKVDFINQTNFTNASYPEENFIQYWKFGDGTGSFQQNPSHEFPDYGTYDVSLATFIVDCGCWHVHSTTITIVEPHLKDGNPDCPFESIDITPNWSNEPLGVRVDAIPNIGAAILPNTQVLEYYFEFFTVAGTPIYDENRGVLDFIYYEFAQEGEYKVRVTATWDEGCESTSEFHEFTLYTPVPEAEGCDQNHKVKDTYHADYQGNSYRLKIVDHARGTWGTQSWRKIHGQQILYRKKPGQWFWHTYSAWHEIHRTGYFYEVVDKNCETGYNLVDNGPFKSCYGERYQWISPGLSFPNQFGLDEGSVKFNHKVYIWGGMVTQDDWTDPDPSEQDFYNCHNPWGHLLFDRNVWVGQP